VVIKDDDGDEETVNVEDIDYIKSSDKDEKQVDMCYIVIIFCLI
jgi:hypothetical protein